MALAIIAYSLVLIWAIEIIVRLGDQRKLLKQIADDIAALRGATLTGREVTKPPGDP